MAAEEQREQQVRFAAQIGLDELCRDAQQRALDSIAGAKDLVKVYASVHGLTIEQAHEVLFPAGWQERRL